ncbi:MAG: hypothetical protein A2539_05790 [Elusimicrobia bacterium RIFOXYD2_FULL_34_15]|nr:MAG: hypothetical protein A2539_05790 [Elusimicrobia bacterium RIFOXYD2_FULL_34_15]
MKTGVKVSLWLVGIVILVLVVIIGPEYEFVTTYPAACWSDDGKQIIYLENKELSQPLKLAVVNRASRTLKSATYLVIMDADGKKKKEVGKVPDLTNEQKDLMKGGRLPKNELEEMNNIIDEFYLKNLSKNEIIRLKKGWLVLNEKNPKDDRVLVTASTEVGIEIFKIIYKDKIEKKILKTSISKSYLFIPFWWKV